MTKTAKTPTIPKSVLIEPRAYLALKEYSKLYGIKLKWLLNKAIEEYLKNRSNENTEK